MEKFRELGLCEHVLKAISNKKFVRPSEIQEKTIPLILEGKDIIAGSATGSGKTLAFASGMIKNVEKGRGIQGLVLTPTRELAEQVAMMLEEFGYYKELEIVSVYGGVSMVNQTKKLVYADVVVATPGRLLDHLRQNSVNLNKVVFLVLDEADRMWDMGFKEDVSKIVKMCPEKKQTLLFSATISEDLADFAGKYMKFPVEIIADSYVDASKLKQVYYDVRDSEKFSLLVHLLKITNPRLAMVFCNTRRNADFVAKNLRIAGVRARVIHGGMEQAKRIQALKDFSNGDMNVIVCTDVASRGLDIKGISHVYNYDLPKDHKDYVHRIGRTARAGKSGLAVNILASRDYDNFSNIQRHNEELVVSREMTPRFERVNIKFDEPRRFENRSGVVRGRNVSQSGRKFVGGNRGPVRKMRGVRGERNFGGASRDGFRSGERKFVGNRGERIGGKNKDGFRGGGRNTRNRVGRR